MEIQYPDPGTRQQNGGRRPYIIHDDGGGDIGGSGGGDGPSTIEVTMEPIRSPSDNDRDNDRSSGELQAVECNLTSLCDHIQLEGFNNGAFFDVIVHVMGSTYHLHRLILSRSSYFRSLFLISCFFFIYEFCTLV